MASSVLSVKGLEQALSTDFLSLGLSALILGVYRMCRSSATCCADGGVIVLPAEGIQVDEDEVYISGNANVFVPVQRIQTDERYYVDSKQFVPKR